MNVVIHKRSYLEGKAQPLDDIEASLDEQIALINLQLGQLRNQKLQDIGNFSTSCFCGNYSFPTKDVIEIEDHELEINRQS